ncbi:YvrJ family protein [Priestia megaterium]|uniref:YvrJ family protein n=1 Tax=Priestia megaterium TaxID=1404 RepID=UPI002FFF4FDC
MLSNISEWSTLISNFGFPILLSVYLLLRFEQKIEKFDQRIEDFEKILIELVEVLREFRK